MKNFEMPKMVVVTLSIENIVTRSTCLKDTCYGFTCDNCGSCTKGYYCDVSDCHGSYNGYK